MDYTFSPAAAAAIVIFLIILFSLEYFFPLRVRSHSFKSRLVINIILSLLVFFTAFLLVMPAVKSALGFTSDKNFGILYLLNLTGVTAGIAGFLLMDLAFYYWHLMNHKVPFLWRFHNVHHIDPDLDVSTAFRFHFGEIAFSSVFRIVQITIIGIAPAVFIIYELCFNANTLFHHSNIRLPINFERKLNKIIVTPRMHGIHHSQIKNETNSNYSTVFPWWDWVHRTIGLNVPQKNITIGVPAYSGAEDNKVINVFTLPFIKQRDYWKKPDGEISLKPDTSSFKEKLRLEE